MSIKIMYFQRLSHEAKIAFKIYFEFLIDVIRLDWGKVVTFTFGTT